MAVQVKIDTSPLEGLITRAQQAEKSFALIVTPIVNNALKEAEGNIKDLIGGPVLKVRSGVARESVHAIPAQVDAQGVSGQVGTNVPYLYFQYTGGTIRPRNARNLAIPIGNALTPAGVPRYATPRQIPDLIFIPRTRAGNTILALRKPGGGIDPLFVLKKQVTIPPHDFLTKPAETLELTLKKEIPEALTAILGS